ncbi:MAG: hypothetical protein ACXVJT_07810 [Thermoanaerobaculia bacterium]
MRTVLALCLVFVASASAAERRRAVSPGGAGSEFSHPEPVTIQGYTSDAMEPFITRDGRYLLFNDSNAPGRDTNLHYAERIDDTTFVYRGEIDGVNSTALDGVATVDGSGTMYFVSTRSYAETLSSIYRASFQAGTVHDVALVSGLSKNIFGAITFDVEVSADGGALYLSDGVFTGGSVPVSADLAAAVRENGEFKRLSSDLFANVNTDALEYAACLSANQLELFFTRLIGAETAIYRSVRSDPTQPWAPPQRISAITGFVEAPALSPDGRSLYYHALRGARFVIERVSR